MKLPWSRKKKTNARVIEPITKGQSESGGRVIPNLPDGLEVTLETRDGKVTAVSIQPKPMIHQITYPIDWKGDAIGTRYGPGRCNEQCTEVHAYAEKVSANTVAFERPCVSNDAGAAQKRKHGHG